MKSAINRGIRMAVSSTAKSVSGARKPDNTGLWTNIRSRTLAGHGQVSDKNQSLFGKIGEIRVRSTSQLIRIWEQQKCNYSMKHQEFESMKHQEIEGPTVERDMSEVAKESRLVTESMMKSMYDVSKSVAALAVFQLAVGGYMSWKCSGSGLGLGNDVLTMSVSAVAFGFPFSMALMMRQSLKGMQFFDRMEKLGRLQLLTSSMQILKQIRLFFLRLRVVAYTSITGLFLSLLYSLLAPVISST